jgi:hypothetical protein
MAARDSIPARLLPFTLLREGNVDFDEFDWLFRAYHSPYFLHRSRGGHWLSAYAIATPVVATPLSIPVVWWLRHNQISDDDVRFRLATVVMERVGAAFIAAVSVSLMFLCLCRITSVGMAEGVALVYGLGTSVWSVASQSLLQHGLAALSLAGMSVFLLGPSTRRNAVAAGGLAALAVLARPTMAIFSALAFVFVWRERREHLLAFLSIPLAGMVALGLYNRRLGGMIRGGYHRLHFAAPSLRKLAGLLVNPNRGLLPYTPAAVLALPILVQRGSGLARWVAYLPIGIGGYLVFYSAWLGWWGGHTYGPRFLTDALPAITLCAVPAVEKLWRTRMGQALVLTLVAWGVAVQAIGVFCDDNTWNANRPSRRIWSLADLQIVRVASAGWHGSDLVPLVWNVLTDPRPAVLRTLNESELAGEVEVVDPLPLRLRRGRINTVGVRVTNRSGVVWPAFSDFNFLDCVVGYRWLDKGRLLDVSGSAQLPGNVGPEESVVLHARIEAPARPGQYNLELLLVQVLGPKKAGWGGAITRLSVLVE